jgi:hypothetical protein
VSLPGRVAGCTHFGFTKEVHRRRGVHLAGWFWGPCRRWEPNKSRNLIGDEQRLPHPADFEPIANNMAGSKVGRGFAQFGRHNRVFQLKSCVTISPRTRCIVRWSPFSRRRVENPTTGDMSFPWRKRNLGTSPISLKEADSKHEFFGFPGRPRQGF